MDNFPIKPDGFEQMVQGWAEAGQVGNRTMKHINAAWHWVINSRQFCIDNLHYQIVSQPDPNAEIVQVQLVGGGPVYNFTWEMLAIALDQKRFGPAMYRRAGA